MRGITGCLFIAATRHAARANLRRMTSSPVAVAAGGLAVAALTASLLAVQPALSPAVAWRDCAPWDGAAFTVAVGRPGQKDVDRAQPWLRIAIWHEASIRNPVTYRFPDTDGKTGAVQYGGTAFPSVTGTVSFTRAVFGDDLDGSFAFVAPDGQKIVGRFHGRWSPDVAVCGL